MNLRHQKGVLESKSQVTLLQMKKYYAPLIFHSSIFFRYLDFRAAILAVVLTLTGELPSCHKHSSNEICGTSGRSRFLWYTVNIYYIQYNNWQSSPVKSDPGSLWWSQKNLRNSLNPMNHSTPLNGPLPSRFIASAVTCSWKNINIIRWSTKKKPPTFHWILVGW